MALTSSSIFFFSKEKSKILKAVLSTSSNHSYSSDESEYDDDTGPTMIPIPVNGLSLSNTHSYDLSSHTFRLVLTLVAYQLLTVLIIFIQSKSTQIVIIIRVCNSVNRNSMNSFFFRFNLFGFGFVFCQNNALYCCSFPSLSHRQTTLEV